MSEQEKQITFVPKQQENSGRNPDGTFKPGVSGNPAGRPKFSLVAILKEELNKYKGEEEKDTVARELILKYIEKAKRGDPIILRDMLNRIDGMPSQKLEHGLDDSVEEIEINIVRNKDEVETEHN